MMEATTMPQTQQASSVRSRPMPRWRSVSAVWQRHFAVFRKDLIYGLVTTFVEPLLYFLSFGLGLGRMIESLEVGGIHVSYRSFIFAGLVGQTLLFIAFFEGAYGGFIRMYYQKIFQAIAVTPVTLSEVLWGEVIWCASRAMLPAVVVLTLGCVLGDLRPLGCLAFLPVAVIGAILFASLGMLAAGLAKTIESLGYPQYLFIIPMLLFCGVYYPLQQFPDYLQTAMKVLPLTAILSLARFFTLGTEFEWWSLPVLLLWTVFSVYFSRRSMFRRMVS